MSGPNRPTQGEKIAHADWTAKAIGLALKGWSTRRIGKKLGLHHSTVADALNAEFERVRPSEEEVSRRRTILGVQLEEQIASWRPRSLGGDKDAALVLVRFKDRYAKLYGLDAPTRTELSGEGGGPVVFNLNGITNEQLSAVLAATDQGDESGASGSSTGGAGETPTED